MPNKRTPPQNNFTYTWSDELAEMPDDAIVKVTRFTRHAEAVTVKNNRKGIEALQNNRRISSTQYVDADGVIHDYECKGKERSVDSVKESIKKIRSLIQYNFLDFELWHVTLTYAEHEYDFKKAANDFVLFFGRLETHYRQYKLEYLRIIEAHDNGAWHTHVLMKTADPKIQLRLSAAEIEQVWGKGSVKARQVGSVDEMIKYFGTVHREIKQDGHKLSKTEQKQLRWHYYPPKERIYAKSNGIKTPPTDKIEKDELQEYLQEYGYKTTSNSQSSLVVTDTETGKQLNTINYETFIKE